MPCKPRFETATPSNSVCQPTLVRPIRKLTVFNLYPESPQSEKQKSRFPK